MVLAVVISAAALPTVLVIAAHAAEGAETIASGEGLSERLAARTGGHGADVVVEATGDRGIAEEAPGAYKDVSIVVDATEKAGLARKVARLEPLACIKG